MSFSRRKTWLRIVIAAGLGLAAAYGVYLIIWLTSDREEIEEANRLDPGWRLEELEQKRELVADEENGALVVLAASKLWPPQRGSDPDAFWSQGGTEESIIELPPQMQLNAEQQKALKKELEKVRPALEETRKLLRLSRGRYPSTGSREDGSAADDCQESRRVANLLQLDSIFQAQETHVDEALERALGVLNAGRSIGDDPYTLSQLVRISCDALAIRNLERVLAQGEPSQKTLLIAQHSLEDEIVQPLLLQAARGDRADTFRKMTIAKMPIFQPGNLRGIQLKQIRKAPPGRATVAPPGTQSGSFPTGPFLGSFLFVF